MNLVRSRLLIVQEVSFLLLVFSLGFMQPNVEVNGLNLPVTDLLFLVTGLIWLLAVVSRQIELRWNKFYILLGLYALALLVSALLSENPRFSIFKFLGEIYLIGLAVMTFNIAAKLNLLKKIIFVWLSASVVTSVVGTVGVASFYLGISNFLTDFSLHHYGSLPAGNYTRIQSTFLYPSMLCNYLTVSLLMLIAAYKLRWIGRRTFFIILTIFSITIAFTVTPGIGGVLLAVGLWFWFYSGNNGNRILPRLSLAGGLFAAFCFLLVSTFSLYNASTSPYFFTLGGIRIDPSARLLTWQGAFQTFLEHPFFGKGLGLGVASVYYMPPSGQMLMVTDAHNVFLNAAGEAGVFGMIALALICVFVVVRSRFTYAVEGEEQVMQRCLEIAFISCFLYQGLVGSFEDARHLWVLIGLILALSANSRRFPQT